MRHLVVATIFAAIAALNLGCGSAVLSAADSGDLASFRTELAARVKAGDVDVGEAQDIARTLTKREILTAQGQNGIRTIEAVSACWQHFDGALDDRSDTDDEVAAHATLVRQDAGKVAPMRFLDRLASEDDHWRAVAARSLIHPEPRPGPGSSEELVTAARWRRKLMADRASIVRLSALRSAIEAADRGDVDDVLAAARLDPDRDVRYVAMEAAGQIGTREAVLGLKDVWNDTDEDGKLAIVHAWAAAWRRPYHQGDEIECGNVAGSIDSMHPSCEAWFQLQRVSDEGAGMPALLASLELIHDVSPAEAKTTEGNAASVVERLIDKAAPRVRVEAIGSAPIAWAHLLEAIVEASKDNEDLVVVAASARMVELGGKDREEGLKKLRKLVTRKGQVGDAAALALAEAGDPTAVKRLEAMGKSASREQRIKVAAAFAALGDATRALAFLGDLSTEVRTATTCAILSMD
jgi:HEAT repeat protein